MRIVHLCADPGVPVFGRKGASVHVQEVVRALRGLGHEVVIAAARIGGEPPEDLRDVEVHRLPKVGHDGTDLDRERSRREAGLRCGEVLDQIALTGPIDLVYERYSLWGASAMIWARATGVPGVLEVNAPLPDEQARFRTLDDRGAADRVAATAIDTATTVVAVSEPVRRWAVDAVAPELRLEVALRSHVVPNGVDTDRIRPTRRVIPTETEPITVGFVGTLKPWHGLDTLADAAVLLDPDRRWRILLVGDGPERESIAARLAQAGPHVEATFTGAVDPAQVPRLLSTIDIAVAPYPGSTSYFSPLKLMEYMAAGLPIVASDVDSVTDVITHRETGVVVSPDDPAKLAKAIGRLAADPLRRAQLGERARSRAVRHHRWTAAAARILDLIPAPVGAS